MPELIEIKLTIPRLQRPTLEELRNGPFGNRPFLQHIVWDKSSTAEVKFLVGRVIRADEESVDCSTYLSRLTQGVLGFQHAWWLRENFGALPEEARKAIDQIVPANFIDFPGILTMRCDGTLGVPTFCQGNDVHFAGLSHVFHRRIAVGVPTA